MEIRLKNPMDLRRVMDELHLQLLEGAYWVSHYFGQAIHNTELDRRLGREYADDVERELGSPRFNQPEMSEEEFLEQLDAFLLAQEEADETYDS